MNLPKADRLRKLNPSLVLWLLLTALALLPIFSEWEENRYQVSVQDLVVPLVLSLLTSSLLSFIFRKKYISQPIGSLLGASFSTLIISHDFQTRLITFTPFLHALDPIPKLETIEPLIFSFLFFAAIVYAGFLIIHLVNKWITKNNWPTNEISKGLNLLIGLSFALVTIPLIYSVAVEWPQFSYRPPLLSNSAKVTTDKPDIYYIVLDRYTSQSVLTSQFNFDNSAFIQSLQAQGFSVNPNAHNNYPYTTMSIASTMNASYNSDLVQKFAGASQQTQEPFHAAIRYSSVVQELKSFGYSYDEIGSWYEASNKAPLADTVFQPEGHLTLFGHTFTLDTFDKNELVQSPFWQVIQNGISLGKHNLLGYSSLSEVDSTPYKLKALTQLASQPAGGRFIFAHILTPHDPYFFNADGSLSQNSGNDNNGEPIKQKYVNQVEYINSQIKPIIDQINKASNHTAVIILQADEGPYPMVLNGNNFDGTSVGDELSTQSMLSWSDQDLQMKYGTLSAYSIPKASSQAIDAEGDSVNIFRLVLNTYFDTNLPYLPKCYYAYPDGREHSFVFTDITQRLTGTANPLCSKDSSK